MKWSVSQCLADQLFEYTSLKVADPISYKDVNCAVKTKPSRVKVWNIDTGGTEYSRALFFIIIHVNINQFRRVGTKLPKT